MRFSEVVGHSVLKKQLISDFRSGRLPHALMFLAESGLGELPLAMAMSQYMNCENPGEEDSCGECPSCTKVAKMIHPDVHYSFPTISKSSGSPPVSNDYIESFRSAVLDNPYLDYYEWIGQISQDQKQGNITRDECREIANKLGLKSFESKYKILIMWLPEFLGNAGNSLLKLIEEPPANTYFFFVANDYDRILNTILSRARLIKLKKPDRADIENYLREYQGAEPDVAETIAYISEGNVNRAINFLGMDDHHLTDRFREWMLYCYNGRVDELLLWTTQMGGETRDYLQQFLEHATVVLRQCVAARFIPDYRVMLPEKYTGFVVKFSRTIDEYMVEQMAQWFSESNYYIGRNANAKIVLFDLSLKIKDELRRERVA